MTELWKLPKAERTVIKSKVEELNTMISKLNASIARHKNQLASDEWMLNNIFIELVNLRTKHNIHD